MDQTDSFGYWVRRRRKALDLTQEEMAQLVGCAVVTLRKIEADERRPSPQMARRLALYLALADEERPAFLAAAVGQQTPARLPWPVDLRARRPAGNLPAPLTPLVGRAAEIDTITGWLRRREMRLLTLTGPVGVGKTRLALEAGWRLLAEYREGVYLVTLASVQDPTLVTSAMATALGVREARDRDLAQSVAAFLATREVLLIFDNFEHLLPAASFLSDLLATCPKLHVLVTSRARLHLYGEHEFVVHPLSLPDVGDPLRAADAPAVRLFCDRARAARADFQLTPSLTPVVAEICRRLDGLPLAIELAAARLKLLSPQELHGRLERRLSLLSQGAADLPSRQHGLYDAVAWSYGLLSPAERTLMARLAVFVGGFSLPAAEATCAYLCNEQASAVSDPTVLAPPAADIAGSIDALLDQSLLVRKGEEVAASFAPLGRCGRCPLRALQEARQAESRFAMLEIIREFALEQLQASGQLAAMQCRHAAYFAAWAEQAEAQMHGPDQATWLARLEQEAGNLRAALTTLLATSQVAAAAGMVCSLGAFWQRHGHYSEGRRWSEQVLAQMAQTPVADALRARTLQTAATLAYRQGAWQTARQWLAESLALFRSIPDPPGIARVLFDLGWIAIDQADWAEAARLNQESLALARAAGDPCAIYRALTNLGWTQLSVGQRDTAAALFGEAFELASGIGHAKGMAVSLANLGWIALYRGDTAAAVAAAQDSLRLCCLLGEREVMAECLEILAIAAVAEGDAQRAAQLSGAAEAIWQALHVAHPSTQHSAQMHGQALAAMRCQLIETTFESTWRRGWTMSLDEMAAFALGCGVSAR